MSAARGNRQVTDEQLIEIVREAENPYTTPKRAATHLPVTRQAVGKRLRKLAKEGVLERDKVGKSAVLYSLPDE